MVLLAIFLCFWSIRSLGGQVTLYAQYTYPLTGSNLSAQADMEETEKYLLTAILQKAEGKDFEQTLALAETSVAAYKSELEGFSQNQRNGDNDVKIGTVNEAVSTGEQARAAVLNSLRDSLQDYKAAYSIFKEDYLPAMEQAIIEPRKEGHLFRRERNEKI